MTIGDATRSRPTAGSQSTETTAPESRPAAEPTTDESGPPAAPEPPQKKLPEPGPSATHPSRSLASKSDATHRSLPGYQSATAEQRARIDALMDGRTTRDQQALRAVLGSEAWRTTTVRDDILTLLENLPRAGHAGGDAEYRGATAADTPVEAAVRLMNPRATGAIAPMLDRAHDGKTLAHHLARAATTPPDAALLEAVEPISRDEIIAELVRETADPGRINQGPNTCGATVIQYQLVATNPAEYVRLAAGLLSPGEVISAGGTTLRRDADSIFPTASHCRSPTEQIFQGALMELGSPANYRVKGDTDVQAGSVMDRLPGWLQILSWLLFPIGLTLELIPLDDSGLMPWEYEPAAEAVFGHNESFRLSWKGAVNHPRSQIRVLERMQEEGDLAFSGVAISVTWGPGHFLNVVGFDRTTTPPSLLLRNPHGSESTKNRGDSMKGGIIPDGIVLEDPHTGVVRMPLTEEHIARISGLYYPAARGVPDPTWDPPPL